MDLHIGSTILLKRLKIQLATNLKIILLDHKSNYVEISYRQSLACRNDFTRLSVLFYQTLNTYYIIFALSFPKYTVIFARSVHFLPTEIYTSSRNIIVACVLNKKISGVIASKIAARINPERTVTSRNAIVASLEMSYRLPAL